MDSVVQKCREFATWAFKTNIGNKSFRVSSQVLLHSTTDPVKNGFPKAFTGFGKPQALTLFLAPLIYLESFIDFFSDGIKAIIKRLSGNGAIR